MDETAITNYIQQTFPDVEMTTAYGYDMFFYKSDRKLSFATLINADYDHDRYSNLDRPGVFRLNIGVSKRTFEDLFGAGAIDPGAFDYTALDVLMPHPEYAAYHFLCVLSPSAETFARVRPLLAEAYTIAARRFASQTRDHAG